MVTDPAPSGVTTAIVVTVNAARRCVETLEPALAPGPGSLLVWARKCPDLEDEAARRTLASLAVPVVLVA